MKKVVITLLFVIVINVLGSFISTSDNKGLSVGLSLILVYGSLLFLLFYGIRQNSKYDNFENLDYEYIYCLSSVDNAKLLGDLLKQIGKSRYSPTYINMNYYLYNEGNFKVLKVIRVSSSSTTTNEILSEHDVPISKIDKIKIYNNGFSNEVTMFFSHDLPHEITQLNDQTLYLGTSVNSHQRKKAVKVLIDIARTHNIRVEYGKKTNKDLISIIIVVAAITIALGAIIYSSVYIIE